MLSMSLGSALKPELGSDGYQYSVIILIYLSNPGDNVYGNASAPPLR